MYMLRPVA